MLFVARRRRGRLAEADRRLRAAISDANLLAWYDCRFPWTIDQTSNAVAAWGDVRGATGYGPALAQSSAGAKPTYSVTAGITFDGTGDYLRDTSAYWNGIGDNFIVSLVWTPPAASAGASREVVNLSVGSGNDVSILRVVASATTGRHVRTGYSSPTAAGIVGQTGTRVFHGRHTSDGLLGVRRGSSTEVTQANALISYTATRLTLGASNADTADLFADCTVRALLIVNSSTAGHLDAINQWAAQAHGATL